MNTDSSPLGSVTRIDTRAGAPDIEAFPLEFSGSGGEFFRVWIVNLLLTILTLGFYTPFARRRTAQYFYSHTLVGEQPAGVHGAAAQDGVRLPAAGGDLRGVQACVGNRSGRRGRAVPAGRRRAGALLLGQRHALSPECHALARRAAAVPRQLGRGVQGQLARVRHGTGLDRGRCSLRGLDRRCASGWRASDAAVSRRCRALAWLLVVGGLVASVLCIIRLEFNYKSLLVTQGRISARKLGAGSRCTATSCASGPRPWACSWAERCCSRCSQALPSAAAWPLRPAASPCKPAPSLPFWWAASPSSSGCS